MRFGLEIKQLLFSSKEVRKKAEIVLDAHVKLGEMLKEDR